MKMTLVSIKVPTKMTTLLIEDWDGWASYLRYQLKINLKFKIKQQIESKNRDIF
eukprot:m.89745 g.89745  ORF g.89745 m.89745 type:complete len:54 (+) comp36622_c1_seq5:722-883(+)